MEEATSKDKTDGRSYGPKTLISLMILSFSAISTHQLSFNLIAGTLNTMTVPENG